MADDIIEDKRKAADQRRHAKHKARLAARGQKRIMLTVWAEYEVFLKGVAGVMLKQELLGPLFYNQIIKYLENIKAAKLERKLPIGYDAVIIHGPEIRAAKELFGADFKVRIEQRAAEIKERWANQAPGKKPDQAPGKKPDQ